MTWLAHVKSTMKREAGKKASMGKKWFKHVLKTAKQTYKGKKGRRGGADGEPEATGTAPAPPVTPVTVTGEPPAGEEEEVGGRRRRRGSKNTRRHRGRKH